MNESTKEARMENEPLGQGEDLAGAGKVYAVTRWYPVAITSIVRGAHDEADVNRVLSNEEFDRSLIHKVESHLSQEVVEVSESGVLVGGQYKPVGGGEPIKIVSVSPLYDGGEHYGRYLIVYEAILGTREIDQDNLLNNYYLCGLGLDEAILQTKPDQRYLTPDEADDRTLGGNVGCSPPKSVRMSNDNRRYKGVGPLDVGR